MKQLFLFMALAGLIAQGHAQKEESFDYWSANRKMIRHGVQAILTCNGLFTSDRSLEQVYERELKYLENPVGSPQGGDYLVDWEKKASRSGPGSPGLPCGRCSGKASVA